MDNALTNEDDHHPVSILDRNIAQSLFDSVRCKCYASFNRICKVFVILIQGLIRNDTLKRFKKVIPGNIRAKLRSREIFTVFAVKAEIGSSFIIKSQKIDYIADVDLNKACLVMLSIDGKLGSRGSQTQLL